MTQLFRRGACVFFFIFSAIFAADLSAQPLLKSAVSVDAGNTKQTGATFGYRLTYNCSSTSGPCLNAEVDDLLPAAVQEVSTVPASPTGDVAAINVTPNFSGTGRTRVQFVMINPLPAGNSGDLLVNVRFPNGSTPNGTVAINTADGINLGATPGTFTTPPVNVTAVATVQAALSKTLTSSPANLDTPESYRLRVSNPNNNGALNLTAIGPVVDTLPPGVVFNGATPAADCQPGCVGTTPATISWTSPCTVPLAPNQNCDITVNVTFPSATFPSGTNVTNAFTTDATPLGQPPQNLGVGQVTHPVTTFVPSANAGLSKAVNGNSPNPPTLNQTFSYNFNATNSGNVPLDSMVVIDTLPVEFALASATTGAYNNLASFAAGVGVRVSYEKNTAPGVFTLWGSSPNTTTNTTLTSPPPGLGAGEYVTRIRWEYGQAAVGMSDSTQPAVTGQIVNPDNSGGPVAFGDSVQNCVALTAVYTAGPTNVTRSACNTFTLSGPFVQLNPAKDNLSGGGPFNPGQTVSWRLRVRSDARSSDPVPLQSVIATDLLPVDLTFASWTFDDQGTGLPAPQTFDQIPNFNNTGRTLLRWRWNAGSGSLGVNQQVWINISTSIRSGAQFGSLSNDLTLDSDAPGLALRCSGSSQADALDYDGDGDTAETLCRATGTITVAPIAQLVSSKTIQGTCDGGSVSTSNGTLVGGALKYQLHVSNPGTVPMQNFVMVDILPFVGDTGVRDASPRGSQWEPLLAAPINPPPDTVIYYSTSGNPCRGEVGGPTTSCDAPNWTTVPPDPITSVRSFKVEFGSRVVNPFDSIDFTFTMVTPGNVPASAQAFNSFAYQADRADGLGSLAAEPQKVGVAIGSCTAASLGDFVWVDANKNGTQDDGPTGLNGVYVRLFQPGADGIPGDADDVLLSAAVTGNGPDGAPGWYNFPGLAPGSYNVCVTAPPTFIFTDQNIGDDTKDSDVNTSNSCTQVVTLAANENNPTLDAGLIATQLSALGDYVWFDRNSDGVQNEAVTDGANGVTVKLFIDNGDGNANPANDTLVATTVTADDVYGRAGYYRFDGLIPGLPYFVQFVKPASATGFTSLRTGADRTVDSDANTTSGVSSIVILAPGQYDPTIDAGLIAPSGTLSLGDQVWRDSNNNGIYEPQNGEIGIDGVRLDLYRDVNGDGVPTLDEYSGTTTTATQGGFAGRYRFRNLAPGNYIVVVDPSAFGGSGALSGLVSSTGNDPAPDPDDDVNGDDNGTAVGALTASLPVTLSTGGEPTSEDGDANTNLTVDFGFIAAAPTAQPQYDYGDAPDVTVGTAHGDYNTTVLDNGPYHLLGVPNAPYLGHCVDADSGFNQGIGADADDNATSALTIGTCDTPGHDEDGVTFTSPVLPGATMTFSVLAGGPSDCHLDAWVDWDQDGVFSAGEQIALNQVIAHGSTPAPIVATVPATAVPGTTYARFRCSSAGNLPPTGPAADGEVEDYAVGVIGYDYGDAPDTYKTTLAAGGARHTVVPGTDLYLGSCVDTEADGVPSVNADGDDNAAGSSRIGLCLDDEDGVIFTTPIVACATTQVRVSANAPGKLDAWLDFDRNGTFDTTDKIFDSVSVTSGAQTLSFTVPCTASQGTSYARFRLSSAGGLNPGGTAGDGEVEDYAVNIGTLDFGDAPNSYGTTFASNGARHVIVSGFSLGATEDGEADGQPGVNADGDGADEDGVTIPATLLACSTATIPVSLTNTAGITGAKLDAWIDFDGDGHFDNPRDRVATALPLVSGANSLLVFVPCDAKPVSSYARFRLSSTGVSAPTGQASDGEVEDYKVQLTALDFGDAPDTYGTTLAANGARHVVDPTSTLHLGACVDTEADGAPSAGAIGDDAAGTGVVGACAQAGHDEDGVVFTSPLQACSAAATVTVTASAGGNLDAWIDFDKNGTFDAADQVFASRALTAGPNTLTFAVPCNAAPGMTYARFRLSSAGGLAPTGVAPDGEVEDYAVTTIANLPQLGLAKRLSATAQDTLNHSLFHLSFVFDVVNSGNANLSNLQIVDNLAATFAGAVSYQVTGLSSTGGLVTNGAYNGGSDTNVLAAGNTLATGAAATVTVNVDLIVDALRTFSNTASATGLDPGNNPVTDTSTDGGDPDPDGNGDPNDNSVPTPIVLPPQFVEVGLSKALTGESRSQNDPNKYRLTFSFNVTNPGDVDLSNVQVTDDLSSVFAAATSFQVTGVSASGTLIANAGFNGAADKGLLAAGSTLVAGGAATITLNVDVTANTVRTFSNSAIVTATTAVGGQPVTDTSQNGSNPDPDGDGNPTNNSDPTPVTIPIAEAIIPTPTLGGLGLGLMCFTLMMLGMAFARRRAR